MPRHCYRQQNCTPVYAQPVYRACPQPAPVGYGQPCFSGGLQAAPPDPFQVFQGQLQQAQNDDQGILSAMVQYANTTGCANLQYNGRQLVREFKQGRFQVTYMTYDHQNQRIARSWVDADGDGRISGNENAVGYDYKWVNNSWVPSNTTVPAAAPVAVPRREPRQTTTVPEQAPASVPQRRNSPGLSRPNTTAPGRPSTGVPSRPEVGVPPQPQGVPSGWDAFNTRPSL